MKFFYFHSKSILFASKCLFYLQKKFMVAAVFIFFLFLARNGRDKSLFIRYILNKNVHLTTHCSVAAPLKTFFGKRGRRRRRRRRNFSPLFSFLFPDKDGRSKLDVDFVERKSFTWSSSFVYLGPRYFL